MSDNVCHQPFTWKLTGSFPKGPDFGEPAGTVEFDLVLSEVIAVPSNVIVTYPDDGSNPFENCTLFVVTAPKTDNGNVDIYKYLEYQWDGADQLWNPFGSSPLVLLGSVTKLIPKVQNIKFRYKPPEEECAANGKTPKPPTKATLNVIIAKIRGRASDDPCDPAKRH